MGPPHVAKTQTLLELLGKIARRLLQLVERFGLRPDRLTRPTALQSAGGVAHRPLGPAERFGDIAHPVAELPHDLAERAAHLFLLAGGIAHVAGLPAIGLVATRLLSLLLPRRLARLPIAALLTLLTLLALGAEAAIEQLLLALHQFLQAAHHLLCLVCAALLHLAGAGGAQVLQHVLQLRQQFARLFARAAARQFAGAVEHALQIACG